MTDDRVTREHAEVLASAAAQPQVTREHAEVLASAAAQPQVTREHAEVLLAPLRDARVAQVHAEVLDQATVTARVAQVHAEVLDQSTVVADVAQVHAEVMVAVPRDARMGQVHAEILILNIQPIFPEAPTSSPIFACGMFGTLTVAETDGITYHVRGDGLSGAWTVTATIDNPGQFFFPPGTVTSWSGDLGDYYLCPDAPCGCDYNWRFEGCDLRNGIVRSVLRPLAADFQTNLDSPGQGTLTLATKDVTLLDVWPHLTSVYVERLHGEIATPENPTVEFAGIIEKVTASDGGSTSVGLREITDYLNHRVIEADVTYTGMSQTDIGAALVALASPDGIPLTASAIPSATLRTETWPAGTMVGTAVADLLGRIDGPDYELVHTRTGGAWATKMWFVDRAGADRTDVILRSSREAQGYQMDVDAVNHATHIFATGSDSPPVGPVIVLDAADIYPRWDATFSDTDAPDNAALTSEAEDQLNQTKEPLATPSVTLRGLTPDPNRLRLGDTVPVQISYGAVSYSDPARIESISWAINKDEPETRTLDFAPTTRASEAMLNQTADDDNCPDC